MPKFKMTADEGEECRGYLLTYRQYLNNQRNWAKHNDMPAQVSDLTQMLEQLDRTIHLLDVRIAAAKDTDNED